MGLPVTWWLCVLVSFLFIRSLAYNNLETLPRDVFSGMEALTKVWVSHLNFSLNYLSFGGFHFFYVLLNWFLDLIICLCSSCLLCLNSKKTKWMLFDWVHLHIFKQKLQQSPADCCLAPSIWMFVFIVVSSLVWIHAYCFCFIFTSAGAS